MICGVNRSAPRALPKRRADLLHDARSAAATAQAPTQQPRRRPRRRRPREPARRRRQQQGPGGDRGVAAGRAAADPKAAAGAATMHLACRSRKYRSPVVTHDGPPLCQARIPAKASRFASDHASSPSTPGNRPGHRGAGWGLHRREHAHHERRVLAWPSNPHRCVRPA